VKYTLQFDVRYDEKHWNLTTFRVDREAFYMNVLRAVAPHQGRIDRPLAQLVFPDGTRSLARALIEIAESKDLEYDIWCNPSYTPAEIKEAHFVPFFSAGDYVDVDREWHPLNRHTKVLCDKCGTPDETAMPKLYRLDSKQMRKRPHLFSASNGIKILSAEAFERLASDIGGWVTSGPAAVTERGRIIRDKREYVWIRPKAEVGWYVDAKVQRTCPECGRPMVIRQERSGDIFECNKHVVTSFLNIDAPIALVGNWYGETAAGLPFSNVRDVVISGALHEKIRKMKLKGFVEADYVIHAADEPGHEPPE
jgi:hypothetical protein